MTETWLPTHLHPEYEISDQGHVRRKQTYTHVCKVKPVKPYDGKRSYLKVQLGFRGPRQYVHTLVCIAFHGPKPTPSHTVDHCNFVHTDNRAVNLRWLLGIDNKPRWGGRDPSNGKITWLIPGLDDLEPEDGHQAMTDKERESYDPSANGW
jgi:hypothetical protein